MVLYGVGFIDNSSIVVDIFYFEISVLKNL